MVERGSDKTCCCVHGETSWVVEWDSETASLDLIRHRLVAHHQLVEVRVTLVGNMVICNGERNSPDMLLSDSDS